MSKFKVGDRVAAYTGKTNDPDAIKRTAGEIAKIAANGAILLKRDTIDYWYSPKQCRRLIKRERRRVWIFFPRNEAILPYVHSSLEQVARHHGAEVANEAVEFIEVRKK